MCFDKVADIKELYLGKISSLLGKIEKNAHAITVWNVKRLICWFLEISFFDVLKYWSNIFYVDIFSYLQYL